MTRQILSRIKYPKFLLLIVTFALAYLIFYGRNFPQFNSFLLSLGFVGIFLAGMCFAYGFTAGPATAVFLMLAKEQNLLLAGFIGGLGALTADLIIFRFIRHSFADELAKLSKEKLVIRANKHIRGLFKKYIIPVFAGFIIASPLPDEIGVSLLAASTKISAKTFAVISYLLNTAGILVILFIGSRI
ncbi:MAG: hypothetical protein V1839_02500 [archaeon]